MPGTSAPSIGRGTSGRSNDRNGERLEKLRSKTMRKRFNSNLSRHVLKTTSIGQDGLDFHVWCDRIIHWDLPPDPVDFEQREGRIAR
jgi:ERCC4-related helicase